MKAEMTLEYLNSDGGKLGGEQAERFVEYARQIAEEERRRYMTAPWHARLRYRLYLVWCRVTRQEPTPFGVKVTKASWKSRN